jgi:hypothetical protein
VGLKAGTFGGVAFPQGVASFADEVVAYTTTLPCLTLPYQGAMNALGPPDSSGRSCSSSTNCTYVSLGGGSLALRFVDNVLTGNGDSRPDLWIFEVGDAESTRIEISKDGRNWSDLGLVRGGTSGIDIDALGYGRTDRFRYVRLTDTYAGGGLVTPYCGADIDAVGAISSLPLDLEQITDRGGGLGGGGPCANCCGIDHRQPVLNPEGSALVFSSAWNVDDWIGNRNPDHNRELFLYFIPSRSFMQETVTTEGHSLPYDFRGNIISFVSSSPNLGMNLDRNVEVYQRTVGATSSVQRTDTVGPSATVHFAPGQTFMDVFDHAPLKTNVWQWQTNQAGPTYSLTNGVFRLTIPNTTAFDWTPSFAESPRLAYGIPDLDWTVEVQVTLADFTPGVDFLSGLYVELATNDYLMAGLFRGNSLRLERTGAKITSLNYGATQVALRLDKTGPSYAFLWRTHDTDPWNSWATITNTTIDAPPASLGCSTKTWIRTRLVADFDNFFFAGRACALKWFANEDWWQVANLHPHVSVDGHQLVWASNRNIPSKGQPTGHNADENYEIYGANLTTGAVRQLTDTLGGDDITRARAANLWPRCSGDGALTVFVSDRPLTGTPIASNRYGLFWVDPANRVQRLATVSLPVSRESPPFDLDTAGTRVVFASEGDLVGQNPDGNSEIYVLNPITGAITQVTDTPHLVTNHLPQLSGDGQKIVFLSNGDFTRQNPDASEEIWIYHFDADNAFPEPFVQVSALEKNLSGTHGRSGWMDWYCLDHTGSHLAICANADLAGQNSEHAYEIFLATLHWEPSPPLFLHLSKPSRNTLSFSWSSLARDTWYTVESADTVTGSLWSPLTPVGQWPITETRWSTTISPGETQRFYRVVGVRP